jgi:hypothetical protein
VGFRLEIIVRHYSLARVALAAAVSSLVFVGLPAWAQPPDATRLAADVVAELVATPDVPGARARLSAHFLVVAADYDAYAREHRVMAEAYRRTPTGADSKRPGAPDSAVHCDRLADRATDAATEARALAAAYESATPVAQHPPVAATPARPSASSADLLEATELRRLIEGPLTSQSHARLERHYRALAAQFERQASEHRDLATAYRAAPTAAEQKRPGAPDTAVHCERLADRVSTMAAEARALAARHGEQR